MAHVLCLVAGACAWASCWLLVAEEGSGGHGRAFLVRCLLLVRMLARALRWLAGSSAVELLLALPQGRAVVCEIVLLEQEHGRERSDAEVAAMLVVAGPLALVLGGLASRSPVGALAAFAALVALLLVWSKSCQRRRQQTLSQEMPGVLRTMATALESGHTLVQAIEYVGMHQSGHAAHAFARASLRLRCGISVEDALEGLRQELRAPGIDLMVTALSIAQRTGSPLRALLQRSATLVEQQEEFERLLAVRTAQVRLSVRIVCCLPPLMVCLLALISPDFQAGLASAPGVVSLVVAACLDGLALLIIRRIMEGVL